MGEKSENDWKPFPYEKREEDARKVEENKSQLCIRKPNQKPLAVKTFRDKVTTYISEDLKSRQEFLPLVGPLVDTAKSEPLHLKKIIQYNSYL